MSIENPKTCSTPFQIIFCFFQSFTINWVDDGKFGNGYLNLPPEAFREIRLADAAASSSCFPGGFEPMIMPKDYANGPNSLVSKTWYERENDEGKYPMAALMDGGIIDNQGIEGVKLAEERHCEEGETFIGTYIVSDVSGKMMKKYEVPTLANSMPTTLWFTEKEKKSGILDDLISCGQFTLCRNLSKYIRHIKKKKDLWSQISADKQNEIEEILFSIDEAWKKFNDDPYWLLNQYKR